MSNVTELKVGDRVGVVQHSRHYAWTLEATVTKVTEKQMVARVDGAASTLRFDRRTGYSVGRDTSEAVPLNNERYLTIKAEHEARLMREAEQRNEAQAARDARFGIAAIAGGHSKLERVLHELARSVFEIEQSLATRLERVTPRNLYRELSWLEGSAAKSAELDWLLTIFETLSKDVPKVTALKEFRDAARSQLLMPSTSIYQMEDRAKLLAAREIHERLNAHIKFTLEEEA